MLLEIFSSVWVEVSGFLADIFFRFSDVVSTIISTVLLDPMSTFFSISEKTYNSSSLVLMSTLSTTPPLEIPNGTGSVPVKKVSAFRMIGEEI